MGGGKVEEGGAGVPKEARLSLMERVYLSAVCLWDEEGRGTEGRGLAWLRLSTPALWLLFFLRIFSSSSCISCAVWLFSCFSY